MSFLNCEKAPFLVHPPRTPIPDYIVLLLYDPVVARLYYITLAYLLKVVLIPIFTTELARPFICITHYSQLTIIQPTVPSVTIQLCIQVPVVSLTTVFSILLLTHAQHLLLCNRLLAASKGLIFATDSRYVL